MTDAQDPADRLLATAESDTTEVDVADGAFPALVRRVVLPAAGTRPRMVLVARCETSPEVNRTVVAVDDGEDVLVLHEASAPAAPPAEQPDRAAAQLDAAVRFGLRQLAEIA
jgi:hypothetical protein